jgi:prefoldin subunit 5
VSGAYQKHKGRKTADQIDMLAFGEDGSRRHLERIAAGNGNSEDFEAIVQKMGETGEKIEKALAKLKKSREFVRKNYGAQLANTIDRLIYAGRGKQSIRMELTMLASMDLTFYSADQIAAEAQAIMSNIQMLNDELAEVHDVLAGIDNT